MSLQASSGCWRWCLITQEGLAGCLCRFLRRAAGAQRAAGKKARLFRCSCCQLLLLLLLLRHIASGEDDADEYATDCLWRAAALLLACPLPREWPLVEHSLPRGASWHRLFFTNFLARATFTRGMGLVSWDRARRHVTADGQCRGESTRGIGSQKPTPRLPELRLPPDDSPALRRLPRSPIPRLPDFPTPRLPDSPTPLPVSDSPTPRLPDSPTRRLPVVAASSAQAGLSLSLSRCLPALAKTVSLNRYLWRGAGHCQDACLHRCVAG